MIMNLFNFLWKIEFINVVKVEGVLHNSNDMTKNSYKPYH
jgi:hypothetical protein